MTKDEQTLNTAFKGAKFDKMGLKRKTRDQAGNSQAEGTRTVGEDLANMLRAFADLTPVKVIWDRTMVAEEFRCSSWFRFRSFPFY